MYTQVEQVELDRQDRAGITERSQNNLVLVIVVLSLCLVSYKFGEFQARLDAQEIHNNPQSRYFAATSTGTATPSPLASPAELHNLPHTAQTPAAPATTQTPETRTKLPPGHKFSTCNSKVAYVITGKLRVNSAWKHENPNTDPLEFWRYLYSSVIAPNEADVIFAVWDEPGLEQAIEIFKPCAALFEKFDENAKETMKKLTPGIKHVGDDLYVIQGPPESPNMVYMFYMIWRSTNLIREIESARGWEYETVVRARSDRIYNSDKLLFQPHPPGISFSVNGIWDNRPSEVAEYEKGCGKMPTDQFLYGDSASMKVFGDAFLHLQEIFTTMLDDPGYCEWWQPKSNAVCGPNVNDRYEGTFLNNPEAFVGFHLRMQGIKCHINQSLRML